MYNGVNGHVGLNKPVLFTAIPETNLTKTPAAKIDVPVGQPETKTVEAGAADLYANYVMGGLRTGAPQLTMGKDILTPASQAKINENLARFIPSQEMVQNIGANTVYQFDRLVSQA